MLATASLSSRFISAQSYFFLVQLLTSRTQDPIPAFITLLAAVSAQKEIDPTFFLLVDPPKHLPILESSSISSSSSISGKRHYFVPFIAEIQLTFLPSLTSFATFSFTASSSNSLFFCHLSLPSSNLWTLLTTETFLLLQASPPDH
ncbi:hypothetical protein L873DRAFT_1257336 [Choiromyces venosus 120613-1]|uniref:Uncharacterized protein n=1 Tax=Choiromyces venosus 120613-1 TaxID=1336337 RepID=A0A3N4JFZ3_9PEZI|nr:hypothetical protein L873DRAFT_1257336 [Choiromyces venosus 120613-1]